MHPVDTAYNMGKEAAISDIARSGLEHLKAAPGAIAEMAGKNKALTGGLLGAGAGGAGGYAAGGDWQSALGGAALGGAAGAGGGHLLGRRGGGEALEEAKAIVRQRLEGGAAPMQLGEGTGQGVFNMPAGAPPAAAPEAFQMNPDSAMARARRNVNMRGAVRENGGIAGAGAGGDVAGAYAGSMNAESLGLRGGISPNYVPTPTPLSPSMRRFDADQMAGNIPGVSLDALNAHYPHLPA